MVSTYFADHSNEELTKLCLELIKYNRSKRSSSAGKNDKENMFFQELQGEIVHRFININKEKGEVGFIESDVDNLLCATAEKINKRLW